MRAPRQPGRRSWRDFATAQEAADLAGLEANAHRLDTRRAALSAEIHLITDRCNQRRLYAERKDAARVREQVTA